MKFLFFCLFMSSLMALQAQTTVQQVTAPPMPKELDFAGERVPLENFDVRERLDGELLVNVFQHSAIFAKIKRANRYFPIIEPILREHGIPNDFKYLAVAESGLENVGSDRAALGFWQFIEKTAKENGLAIIRNNNNEMIDERYDVEKSTRAACLYLKKLYLKYDSCWTLAASAYNCGSRQLDTLLLTNNTQSYFELNSGSKEIMSYPFRILAHKLIMQSPSKYGLILLAEDLYSPLPTYKTIEVSTNIDNLGKFATDQGTNYRMLKIYNPWLRNTMLTITEDKKYSIKIPISN